MEIANNANMATSCTCYKGVQTSDGAARCNGLPKEYLAKITDLVTDKTLFCTKEVLTSDEAARYMGISKSYLYKMTMRKQIPHYKPMGKICYFNRLEMEQWLQSNRVATDEELTERANTYCMKGGKR